MFLWQAAGSTSAITVPTASRSSPLNSSYSRVTVNGTIRARLVRCAVSSPVIKTCISGSLPPNARSAAGVESAAFNKSVLWPLEMCRSDCGPFCALGAVTVKKKSIASTREICILTEGPSTQTKYSLVIRCNHRARLPRRRRGLAVERSHVSHRWEGNPRTGTAIRIIKRLCRPAHDGEWRQWCGLPLHTPAGFF